MLPLALVIVAGRRAGREADAPAPPSVIRFLTGPAGSNFRINAEKYKKHIEAHGVKVEIVESQGSLDNLQAAGRPKVPTSTSGFVQGGLHEGVDISGLVSLGTMFPLPLLVYERMPESRRSADRPARASGWRSDRRAAARARWRSRCSRTARWRAPSPSRPPRRRGGGAR